MPKDKSDPESVKLRRRAEERLAKPAKTANWRSSGDMRRLIHELEVHQVELELQNEELRRARVELEANYNELYDFAPVGYFTLTPRGEIENSNGTGARMLGQPRIWLRTRRFAAFIAPESLPRFNDFMRRVAAGRDKESCMVTLMKGGHTPVVTYIEATGGAPDSSLRLVVVDITSAEQAKLALREAEERLKLALAVSGMGMWEWERDTGDIYWSADCMKLSGVGSISPKLEDLVRLLRPEDARRLRSVVSEALAEGKELSAEFCITRPDGEVVWVVVRGQVQYDKAGKPLRLLGIAQDITERKRAEANTTRGPA